VTNSSSEKSTCGKPEGTCGTIASPGLGGKGTEITRGGRQWETVCGVSLELVEKKKRDAVPPRGPERGGRKWKGLKPPLTWTSCLRKEASKLMRSMAVPCRIMSSRKSFSKSKRRAERALIGTNDQLQEGFHVEEKKSKALERRNYRSNGRRKSSLTFPTKEGRPAPTARGQDKGSPPSFQKIENNLGKRGKENVEYPKKSNHGVGRSADLPMCYRGEPGEADARGGCGGGKGARKRRLEFAISFAGLLTGGKSKEGDREKKKKKKTQKHNLSKKRK